jgi:hypothetical protein
VGYVGVFRCGHINSGCTAQGCPVVAGLKAAKSCTFSDGLPISLLAVAFVHPGNKCSYATGAELSLHQLWLGSLAHEKHLLSIALVGFCLVQANHLLPPLKQAAPADGHAADGSAAAEVGVDEDQLARYVGFFLRTCPGLSKVTIGELLGDPDKFFLKVGWGGCGHEIVLSALRVCFGGGLLGAQQGH